MNSQNQRVFFLFYLGIVICHPEFQVQASSQFVRVRFVLSARNLPNAGGVFGKDVPDGYVKVNYFRAPGALGSEKKTEVIKDNYNPDWVSIFEVDFFEGQKQRFKFEIMDEDVGQDDIIGTVEVNLKQIINAQNNELRLRIIGGKRRKDNGELIIYSMIKHNKEFFEVTDHTTYRLSNSNKWPKHFPSHSQRPIMFFQFKP